MNILIIEDSPTAAHTISTILKLSYDQAHIEICDNGYCALEKVNHQRSDLIILDLGLPDISGFEVLKEIRIVTSAPVVVVTARDEEENVLKALEMGADEYIIKPFRHLEFLARVKKALGRNTEPNSGGILKIKDITINGIKNEICLGEKTINLTRAETLIASLLAQRSAQAVSYQEIADAIWGHGYPGAEESIRVYVSRLRSKIEQAGWKDIIHIRSATGVGYLLAIDEE